MEVAQVDTDLGPDHGRDALPEVGLPDLIPPAQAQTHTIFSQVAPGTTARPLASIVSGIK